MVATITRQDVEQELCRRSFPDFLDHVSIQEPPSPLVAGSGGVIPFEKWPHLLEMAGILTSCPLDLFLKARQVGATWLVAAYLAWLCIYRQGTDGLLLSKTEDDAVDFLARVRLALQLLPAHLSESFAKPPTSLSLTLANGSRLAAMAATEDAGRGHVYSVIAQDEADFHPYLDTNYLAVKPTIDAGGQLIMLSTVNKRKMLTLFKSLFRGSPDNGWQSLFIPYSARPGRDEAWRERMRREAPVTSDLSPALYMEQEYPASVEEALAPSKVLAYFDGQVLRDMLAQDAKEPRQGLRGMLSIWRAPVVAGKYVLGADTAWGVTGSYSCASVLDWTTGEQMAELHGRLHPDEMAQECVNLHRLYNHAYMGLERAGEGQERDGESVVVVDKVVELLKSCECKGRLFYHDHDKDKPVVAGWQTDTRSRPVMLGELAEAVRNRHIVLHSRQGIGEMMSFIRNEKGRPEASEGAYDDRVMTYAVAWQMRKWARFKAPTIGGRVAVSMAQF